MKDRDELIEARIEQIMGDEKLLMNEINELDFFRSKSVIEAIQSDDAAQLGTLIMRMIAEQVGTTATQEIDEEASDREEARAVDCHETRMQKAPSSLFSLVAAIAKPVNL